MLTENNMEQNEEVVKDKLSKKKLKAVEKQNIEIPAKESEKEKVFDGEIDLSETRKKRFRINGDNSKILELNTSDMTTLVRLQEDYPKLMQMAMKVSSLKDSMKGDTMEEELNNAGQAIKSIDDEMRDLVDHIFNSNVSEVCVTDGSMYDLFNGKFRFEYIIEKISDLFGANLKSEFAKVASRVQKHTNKYTTPGK